LEFGSIEGRKGPDRISVSVSLVFRVFDEAVFLKRVSIQNNTYNDNHLKLEMFRNTLMISLI
jgi:hypothetical protein